MSPGENKQAMRDWLANQEPFVSRLLQRGTAFTGTQPALWTWEDGSWRVRNWRTIAADVCDAAARLAELGVTHSTRVAHIADNSYAWIVTDLAIQGLGAVHVPLHTALPATHLRRQLRHCEPELAILGARQAGLAAELPSDAICQRLRWNRCGSCGMAATWLGMCLDFRD